jgi:hypothetical protein
MHSLSGDSFDPASSHGAQNIYDHRASIQRKAWKAERPLVCDRSLTPSLASPDGDKTVAVEALGLEDAHLHGADAVV